MYDFFHEEGELLLPGGTVISEDLDPLEDIAAAHDWLFNHQNTAPFFSRKMIQRLVKSNPSPEYIERVSSVFVDNGSGERGDIGAVIKAILLDEEARSADAQFAYNAGMLREPMMRAVGLMRVLVKEKMFNRYWDNGNRWESKLRQRPLHSPTVFNFYMPDYEPVGDIQDDGLVGPEFQLHFTTSATDYINEAYRWGWNNTLGSSSENSFGDSNLKVETEVIFELAESPELLINYLDKRLTYGTMSDNTRSIIRTAMNSMNNNQSSQKARTALYITLISPEYNIIH